MERVPAHTQRAGEGPKNLGPLGSEPSEKAMEMILGGVATPAQAAGFLLVGRARTESASELAAYVRAAQRFVRPLEAPDGPPPVTVARGFDGKLRTFNVGAAATLLAAAASGKFVIPGGEGIPPKCGRTVFEALRDLGVVAPHTPVRRPKAPLQSAALRRPLWNTTFPSSMGFCSSGTRWCAARH
jgi:anthranilate phosphoribosyltransferase